MLNLQLEKFFSAIKPHLKIPVTSENFIAIKKNFTSNDISCSVYLMLHVLEMIPRDCCWELVLRICGSRKLPTPRGDVDNLSEIV